MLQYVADLYHDLYHTSLKLVSELIPNYATLRENIVTSANLALHDPSHICLI